MHYYKSMLRKIAKAFSLPWGDRNIFIEAWLKLLMADLLLRARPFPRMQQMVAGRFKARLTADPKKDLETIEHIQPLVTMAAHNHLYPMNCLRQALTLQEMLGRRGLCTQLRIGVRKESGNLLAHAWLEFQEQPVEVDRHEGEHFTPLIPLDIQP
jgi:hypothetical protein